jgi:hypothetical protein
MVLSARHLQCRIDQDKKRADGTRTTLKGLGQAVLAPSTANETVPSNPLESEIMPFKDSNSW